MIPDMAETLSPGPNGTTATATVQPGPPSRHRGTRVHGGTEMAKRVLTMIVAALPLVVSMAACGSSDSNQATQTSTTTVVVTSPSPSGAQPHNPANVTFAQQMIPHHQQAVQM